MVRWDSTVLMLNTAHVMNSQNNQMVDFNVINVDETCPCQQWKKKCYLCRWNKSLSTMEKEMLSM